MVMYRININYTDFDTRTTLQLMIFKVLKKTQKGYWIKWPNEKGKKFVLEHHEGDKFRPAYISIEKALNAAKHRAASFKSWSKYNYKRADAAIDFIKENNDDILAKILTNKFY